MKPDLIERAKKATAYLASSDARLMRECADALEAAAKAVGELPEYWCTGPCEDTYANTAPAYLKDWKCTCGADEANAKRLAARKAVGLEG